MMTFINYMMTYNKYTTNHIYNVHSAPQTLSFAAPQRQRVSAFVQVRPGQQQLHSGSVAAFTMDEAARS